MHDYFPTVSPGDAIKAAHINAITRAVQKRTPASSPDIRVKESPAGFVMEIVGSGGRGGTFAGRWKPSYLNAEAVSVTGGTVYDTATTTVIPTTTVSVTQTTLNYIFLQINISATTTDSWVTGGTVTSASISANTSGCPANTNSSAYILLATWQAGAVVDRYEWFNFQVEFQNLPPTAGDVATKWWIV